MRPLRLLILVTALSAVAACSAAQPPTASPSPSPSASPSVAPSVVASPSEAPSDAPMTPEPTAAPDATPAPTLSADEAALIGRLRSSAAVDCTPRRTDLPEGALYGIECKPDDPLVQRIGVYHYASQNDAAAAYMTRLAEAGIGANEGACLDGTPGDNAYFPGDGEGSVDEPGSFSWNGKPLVPQRNGCFVDEFGSANVRLVCDGEYIGVLGTRDNVAELLTWAWNYPDGYEPGTPDAPGLCIGPSIVAATP